MEPVHCAYSVLGKLIPEQREMPKVSIDAFRKIGHAVVPILHQVGDKLGILAVILELAVVLDLLGLLDSVRIDLYDTDAISYQPRRKTEPVMPGRLKANDNLVLAIGNRQFQQPILCRGKTFGVIAEGKCLLADFPAARVNGSEIMCLAADVAASDKYVVADKADFFILGKLPN